MTGTKRGLLDEGKSVQSKREEKKKGNEEKKRGTENALCFSFNPFVALLIRLAEWVVLLLGTARTQGGRRSRSPARVSGKWEARVGMTGAEERAMEKEVEVLVTPAAAGRTAEEEVEDRKIGEEERRAAARWRRGWRVARRVGSTWEAMLRVLRRCVERETARDEVRGGGEGERGTAGETRCSCC